METELIDGDRNYTSVIIAINSIKMLLNLRWVRGRTPNPSDL
jgi:hypothetical protein